MGICSSIFVLAVIFSKKKQKKRIMKTFLTIFAFAFTNLCWSQSFEVKETSVFKPQNKKVNLLKNSSNAQLIMFKTNLAVNTDGIPTSYHPYDLRGDSMTLNSILNAISVYRLSDGVNLSVPRPKNKYTKAQRSAMAKEAYKSLESWRDGGFQPLGIKGYKIVWKNVLVAKDNKPCIFSTGKYQGYFASTTALTNGLTQNLGECECNNQVNPFEIPTFVLAANSSDSKNPVRAFGGKVGDLVVAYNPTLRTVVYAIVGDTGPADNLGEGSVILNMKLKGVNDYPTKKSDTYELATDNNIMVCVIPNSSSYNLQRPYTQSKIQTRINEWFAAHGITSEAQLIQLFEENIANFQ